jgi:hypothetical protein
VCVLNVCAVLLSVSHGTQQSSAHSRDICPVLSPIATSCTAGQILLLRHIPHELLTSVLLLS